MAPDEPEEAPEVAEDGAGAAMADAKGLEANSDESWNGEKLDRLIRAERGDEGAGLTPGPAAVLMLPDEAAGAMSRSGLM